MSWSECIILRDAFKFKNTGCHNQKIAGSHPVHIFLLLMRVGKARLTKLLFDIATYVTYSPLPQMPQIKYNACHMDIKEKIGSRIRELRLQQTLSQEKFAAICDLDRTYIASIEKGKRNISIVNLEKIAVALDISISELLKGL